MCIGSEAGSKLRLIDSCIAQRLNWGGVVQSVEEWYPLEARTDDDEVRPAQ